MSAGLRTATSTLRLVAAPFLNTRPLISGLTAAMPPGVTLELCSPAEGARRLAERECDVALLPVAAFARQGDLVAVPGVCIGARHQVGSVLLVADVPLHELTTVALDQSSRTSVTLARLLLRERRATRGEPRYEARPPSELMACVEGTRGAVIIGDPALQAIAQRQFAYTYDLAAEWRALTGKPFVFAVWAGRADAVDADVCGLLARSLGHGLERLDEIAADAGRHGVEPERARRYLRDEL